MSRKFVSAGSVYSYVERSAGPRPAFMVGWIVMLDYLVLPLLNFLLVGLYMHQLLPGIPQWVFSLVALLVIVGLAIKGVSESATLGAIATIVGVLFLLIFGAFMVTSIASNGTGVGAVFDISGFYSADALNDPEVGFTGVLGACSLLCLMFLGFDGITTFAEETKNPRKQIGSAIIYTCIIAGIVYVGFSYLMQLAWPNAWSEMADPDVASTELILRIGGPVMNLIFTAIFVVGCIGSGMSGLSAGARIIYVMGNNGALPKKLSAVHAKYRTPYIAILLIGGVGVLSVFSSLADISSIVNFGALVAFMAVNACVILQLRIKDRERGAKSLLLHVILPGLGFIVNFTIWINLDDTAKIIGFIWSGLGLLVLALRTRGFRRPLQANVEARMNPETTT
jgi:amino acid transporter